MIIVKSVLLYQSLGQHQIQQGQSLSQRQIQQDQSLGQRQIQQGQTEVGVKKLAAN